MCQLLLLARPTELNYKCFMITPYYCFLLLRLRKLAATSFTCRCRQMCQHQSTSCSDADQHEKLYFTSSSGDKGTTLADAASAGCVLGAPGSGCAAYSLQSFWKTTSVEQPESSSLTWLLAPFIARRFMCLLIGGHPQVCGRRETQRSRRSTVT